MTKEDPLFDGYYVLSEKRNGRGYIGFLYKKYGQWIVLTSPFCGPTYFGNELKLRSFLPINPYPFL